MGRFYLLLFFFITLHAETLTILTFAGNEESTDLASMTTLLEQERQNAHFPITALFGDLAPENEPALVEVFNEMKVDFAVFCSERCHQKVSQIKDKLPKAGFSLLAANMIDLDGNSPWSGLKQTHIYQLGDVKVGIFGLSAPK